MITGPDEPARGSRRSIIVVLDDVTEWQEAIRRHVEEFPLAKGLRIATFSSDAEATSFVRAHAAEILGVIQDLNRDPSRPGGVSEGVRFLDEVVSQVIPAARTIVVSAYATFETIKRLYTSTAYQVQFLGKAEFHRDAFYEALRWLLEGRTTDTVALPLVGNRSDSIHLIEELDLPWAEICRYLARHPASLHSISPRLFERLVAEIFRSHGWDVELTARTRDGGFDIIAVRRHAPSTQRVLAEAKRFAPSRPVGVEIVRALYAVRSLNSASQAVLATSSYVSGAAKKEFARVTPWELDFIEREEILSWCRQHGGVEILDDHASV